MVYFTLQVVSDGKSFHHGVYDSFPRAVEAMKGINFLRDNIQYTIDVGRLNSMIHHRIYTGSSEMDEHTYLNLSKRFDS